ncbi:sensor histidine kinase [Telmatobacter bradus]|uniref:sensor histidine kinase n=1 Tax=Telmatobacter bradus TaxID=474953 RepID=UPI003B4343AF
MQQNDQSAALSGTERKRVETVVQTLAHLGGSGETLAEVAHDARNMVTALGLYCELLEEPGVLTPAYQHYGQELKLVATASRRLVEKLVALDVQASNVQSVANMAPGTVEDLEWPMEFGGGLTPPANPIQGVAGHASRWELAEAEHIKNLAAEMLANRNLLAALAGPTVAVTIDAVGGAQPINLTGEDMTRILVNLVKNSAEAMPRGGRIQIAVREEVVDQAASVRITFEDNGPGIPAAVQERIFESGYTTHTTNASSQSWPTSHRGLGLSITRSILEAAGGSIQAVGNAHKGARFEIHLPVRPTRA